MGNTDEHHEWKNKSGWVAELTAQLAANGLDEVRAYAARRAAQLEAQTGISDPGLAEELLADAVGDTFLGTVVWDPGNVPLSLHLKRVIRSRASHGATWLAQFPHVAIDQPFLDFEREVSDAMEERRGHAAIDLDARVGEVIARLRALADDDEPVLQLVDAYSQGMIERRDVMRATGMSSPDYHNAHRRMMRLVASIPCDVRDAAYGAST